MFLFTAEQYDREHAALAVLLGLNGCTRTCFGAAFIMSALDAGVPLRDVQLAARHADTRTTTIYDRRRQNFDRHAAYVVVAFVAGGGRKSTTGGGAWWCQPW